MKKAFITILSILVFSSEIFSQTNTIRPYTNSIQDSLLVSNTYKCGVSQSYFASKSSNNNNNYISPNNFPTSAIMNCGKFSLYFEDLIPTNPQVGFGDPTLGQTRRNTFCAVLNQIENTFDFSNVDPFSPILIYVYTSYAPNSTVALPAAPANVDWFAQGAPTYNVPNIFTTPVNGYVWDYVVSGQNNVSSNNYYHASIRVNFDQIHTQYYINNTTNGVLSIPIAYHDDLSALINPNDNCKTDLYSVLIHEMGHILGDISFVQFPINSNNPPPPSFFSSLDYSTRISQLANPLSPSSALINSNATYNYSNYNSINNLWLNSNTSPNNYPLLSGMLPYGATTAPYTNNIISSDLFITHFDDQPGSYTLRETISPGEKQDYLMSSVLHKGVSHREFSKGDLYLFHNILGYNYSNSFNNTPIANNHIPYTSKFTTSTMISSFFSCYNLGSNVTTNYQDIAEVLPVDATLQNNPNASISIDIANDPANYDDDGDIITVMPGSLINLRGCGDGNNHNQLTVSSNGQTVTFTPRPDFYGKAQFGLNLYDGKEKGAFTIYTINVTRGGYPNYGGGNMVLNGGFEQGTEVKTLGTDEVKENSASSEDEWREGRLFGAYYSDSHLFTALTHIWRPFGGGVAVRNSKIDCSNATILTETVGDYSNSFPSPFFPDFNAPNNLRYQILGWASPNVCGYYYLATDVQYCQKLKLEFDVNAVNYTNLNNLTIGFTDDNILSAATINSNNYSTPPLNYNAITNYSITSNNWTHVSKVFYYCSNNPSNILFLNFGGINNNSNPFNGGDIAIDNVSLTPTTDPLPIEITQSANTNCTSLQLGLNYISPNCSLQPTYSWTPITGLSSSTSPTPTLNLTLITAPTVYTVTIHTQCGNETAQTTVYPTNWQAQITAPSLCTFPTVTLTATPSGNGYSYSWYSVPANVLSSSNIYSATSPGTYYVNITDQSGCTKTQSIVLGNGCCNEQIDTDPATHFFSDLSNTGTATAMLAHFNSSNNIVSTNQNIVIDGTFTVNTNLDLSNCTNVLMHPDAKIVVNNGVTLTLNNGTILKADCNNMWWGISSAGTGQVIINGATLKDMENGVKMEYGSYVNVTNSTFSDNYIGIYMGKTPTNYNGNIQGNIFQTTFNNNGQPNLLAPYLHQKSKYGIEVDNCRFLTIGGTSANNNNFNNLLTGINIEYSGLPGLSYQYNIQNNHFENIIGGQYGLAPNISPYGSTISQGSSIYNDPDGTAVFVNNRSNFGNGIVYLYNSINTNNQLINCTKGLSASGISATVYNTHMTDLLWGLNFSNTDNYQYNISSNSILNSYYGIQVIGQPVSSDIVNNTISTTTSYSQWFNTVLLSYPIGIDARSYNGNYHNFNISNNAITVNSFAGIGINLNNFGNALTIYQNSILLTTNTTSPSGILGYTLQGIALNNCVGSSLQGNHVTGTSAVINTNRTSVAGIYINKSPKLRLECNHISSTRYGFLVISDCSTPTGSVQGNSFNNHIYGILFRHLGTEGTLGTIGDPNDDNNNSFSGLYALNNNSFMKIYKLSVCNTPTYDRIYTSNGTLTNNESGGNNTICKYNIQLNNNPITTFNCPATLQRLTADEVNMVSDIGFAEQVANDTVQYAEYQQGSSWLTSQLLYYELYLDAQTRGESTVLDSFYTAMQNEPIEDIRVADDFFAQGSDSLFAQDSVLYTQWLQDAQGATDAIVGTDIQTHNENIIDNIYLKYLRLGLDSITTNDTSTIANLALSCPYVNGSSVYKARMLYALFQPAINYDDIDICNNVGVYKGGHGLFDEENTLLSMQTQPSSLEKRIEVFPNPTKGEIFIRYQLDEGEKGMIQITDVYGRLVVEKRLNITGFEHINMGNIANGFYFYRFLINDTQKATGKIILNR